jgi:hypothetical protein
MRLGPVTKNFKVLDQFWSPAGYWVVLFQYGDRWLVKVHNFATFRHTGTEFETEAEARRHCDLWRL